MRNLAEYPVTKEEIIKELQTLADFYTHSNTKMVGDMTGLLLRQAMQHVAYSKAPVNEFGLIDEVVQSSSSPHQKPVPK